MVPWPVRSVHLVRASQLVWALVAFALTPSIGSAGFVTATLTADNHYGLYAGQKDGSGLSFVGRNEVGLYGSSGWYNWTDPESYTFAVSPGTYLYVIAWDDYGPQMWIGQFHLPNGTNLFSNTTDWEYAYGPAGGSPGVFGDLPGLPALSSVIQTSSWATPQISAPQGSYPWTPIPGISTSAKYVWSDTFGINGPEDNRYVIFRTRAPVEPVAAVPAPPSATLAVVGAMTMVAGGCRRRVRSRSAEA